MAGVSRVVMEDMATGEKNGRYPALVCVCVCVSDGCVHVHGLVWRWEMAGESTYMWSCQTLEGPVLSDVGPVSEAFDGKVQ